MSAGTENEAPIIAEARRVRDGKLLHTHYFHPSYYDPDAPEGTLLLAFGPTAASFWEEWYEAVYQNWRPTVDSDEILLVLSRDEAGRLHAAASEAGWLVPEGIIQKIRDALAGKIQGPLRIFQVQSERNPYDYHWIVAAPDAEQAKREVLSYLKSAGEARTQEPYLIFDIGSPYERGVKEPDWRRA